MEITRAYWRPQDIKHWPTLLYRGRRNGCTQIPTLNLRGYARRQNCWETQLDHDRHVSSEDEGPPIGFLPWQAILPSILILWIRSLQGDCSGTLGFLWGQTRSWPRVICSTNSPGGGDCGAIYDSCDLRRCTWCHCSKQTFQTMHELAKSSEMNPAFSALHISLKDFWHRFAIPDWRNQIVLAFQGRPALQSPARSSVLTTKESLHSWVMELSEKYSDGKVVARLKFACVMKYQNEKKSEMQWTHHVTAALVDFISVWTFADDLRALSITLRNWLTHEDKFNLIIQTDDKRSFFLSIADQFQQLCIELIATQLSYLNLTMCKLKLFTNVEDMRKYNSSNTMQFDFWNKFWDKMT